MKKVSHTTLASVLIGFTIGFLCLVAAAFYSASAQQATDTSTGERWEYCAITDVPVNVNEGKATATAIIHYFQSAGVRKEEVQATVELKTAVPQGAATLAIGQSAAKLGEEGWELAGDLTQFHYLSEGAEKKVIYFKRRRR